MTCLEKYKQEHPELAMNPYGIPGRCPHDVGYRERPDWCVERWDEQTCAICWNREIPERKPKPIDPLEPHILYRCDRRACNKCSFPDCQHTPDISHAVSFHKAEHGVYIED